MKAIKYVMLVKTDFNQFKETVETTVENETCVENAVKLIAQFNAFLRPFEKERTLLMLRELGNGKIKHIWEKASLVTEKGGYDRYKCKNCKATGKRYGVSSTIIVDNRYSAVYCN